MDQLIVATASNVDLASGQGQLGLHQTRCSCMVVLLCWLRWDVSMCVIRTNNRKTIWGLLTTADSAWCGLSKFHRPAGHQVCFDCLRINMVASKQPNQTD